MNANVLKLVELLVGVACIALAVFLPAQRVELVGVGMTLIGAGGINHHDNGELEVMGARVPVLKPQDGTAPKDGT